MDLWVPGLSIINIKNVWGAFSSRFPVVSVNNNKVEVSFPGRSLVRCQVPIETWELLWELRTSIQAMLHRNFNNPSNAIISQDGRLISLLVELLNNTESNPFVEISYTESEVD